MPADATTVPLGGAVPVERRRGPHGWRQRGATDELTGSREGVLSGALALVSIAALSLFLVLVAANRPSILSPTTHTGYFPRWMAGPLGGLLPGFTNNGTILKLLFTGAVLLMYGGYVVAFKRAPLLPARWLIVAIVVIHAIFLLSPPLALTDLFNYINYGRMDVVHNLNPYTSIPIVEPHNDPSYLLSNWHELLSPYGPLFTLLTFVVVPLGVAGSFWALKLILVATSLGTILLVWKCARLLGRDPRAAVAFVGLNPVVLIWGLGGDHNDFLMMFFIILAFYLLLLASVRSGAGATHHTGTFDLPGTVARLRRVSPAQVRAWLAPLEALEMGAGAALVTAVAIKASGAVLVPVVLAGLLRRSRTLVQVLLGMIAASIGLGTASLLAFGPHIPSLSTQGSVVTSESVPNLVGLAIGLGGESTGLRVLFSGVLVALVLWCCWMAWRGRRLPIAPGATADKEDGAIARAIVASGWASVALLVTLSWVLPWYVLWVLPLAALSTSRRLRTAALVLGVYLIVVWAPASGLLWKALDFYPEKTPLGRLHQRAVKELLN
jgi:alpha-1,6-mannosyltransferase